MIGMRVWVRAMLAAMLAAAPAAAQQAPASPPADTALAELVTRQATAVAGFDQATLAAITTPDYREISPVGDVDTRTAMLGFYAPANKVPSPAVSIAETVVQRLGDIALMSAKLTYTMPGSSGSDPLRQRAMRGGYVARRDHGVWKLVSAQFTPIRVAPAAAK